jgi:ABC-2 type transport system permease protein
MEFRFTFFSEIFINIFSYVVTYLGIWVIMTKFQIINGWTFWEVVLLYNLNLFSYGLGSFVFFVPLQELEAMVQNGTFDGILIRPMNPLLHLLASRQRYVGFLGHVVLGVVIFIPCFTNLGIQMNVLNFFYLITVIFGASLIHSAIILSTCSLSFWVVRSNSIRDLIIYRTRQFIDYPVSIYGIAVQAIMTFILPYAFVNFYPVQYLTGQKPGAFFHPVLQFLSPVVGIIMFAGAYYVWKAGLARYESTGS